MLDIPYKFSTELVTVFREGKSLSLSHRLVSNGGIMDDNYTLREAEHCILEIQNLREGAMAYHRTTQNAVDIEPDGTRNSEADDIVDQAYESLLEADKLIGLGKSLLAVGAYPRYSPVRGYSASLEARSDQQRDKLGQRLRLTELQESGALEPRRDVAVTVSNSMENVYRSHDLLFYILAGQSVPHEERALLDGIIEISLDYMEAVGRLLFQLSRIQRR